MKIARIAAASSFVVLAACASKSSTPEQDKGLEGEGETAAATAPDKNPYGVAYPTDNIGTTPRIGDRAGNRIQNYKFLGYPNADKSQGLQPISLAQFFDPEGREYKIIHIQASGVWCTACQAETEAVVPIAQKLKEMKAVWLVSLAEGPTPGSPSKQKDLDGWIDQFKSPFTHWIDPGNAKLGPFYDRTALPWNANIDATTMEILTSGTGAVASEEGLIQEINDALAMAAESKLK